MPKSCVMCSDAEQAGPCFGPGRCWYDKQPAGAVAMTIDVEMLARALEPEPGPMQIGCDETVTRKGWNQACGRVAVNLVGWDDDSFGAHYYCKLHTTVALRSTTRELIRPLTSADHEAASADRRARWLARAEAIAARYEQLLKGRT